jgi:hypothetical protein
LKEKNQAESELGVNETLLSTFFVGADLAIAAGGNWLPD